MTHTSMKNAALALTASIALALPVSAQAKPASCQLFTDAITNAANNDPQTQIARADLENARANLQQAKSLRRPQISSFGRTGIGDNGLVDSQIENQVGLRASQRVIDFGDSRLAKRAAREEVRAQESLILDARGNAALNTALEYVNWLEAEAQLKATRERISYFQDQLNAIESVLETGGATILEQAEVAAEIASAEAEQFEFRFRRDRAISRIAITTGIQLPPCPVEGDLIPKQTSSEPSRDEITQLTSAAINANPQLEALRRTTAGLNTAAKREARARLPIIDVVGIASFASQEFDGGFSFQNRVGVNVSVPLYSGNALTARKRQASARAARSGGELAVAQRQLREDVTLTYQRSLLLEGLIINRAKILDLKRQEFEGRRIEHENGLRTLPELIETRLQLEDASLDEISARFSLERERISLSALTGELLKLDNIISIQLVKQAELTHNGEGKTALE